MAEFEEGLAQATVGRTAEQQTLQTWLSAEHTALLLIGEPGIGKTRLLEELTQMVQAISGTVLPGRGFEAELLRPYGVWVDALRSLPSDQQQTLPPELGTLLPELGTPSEPLADRGRLFDGVIGLLHQIAIAPLSSLPSHPRPFYPLTSNQSPTAALSPL